VPSPLPISTMIWFCVQIARSSVELHLTKAVVRANQNNAGIYGAVTRIGRLAVGQTILLCGDREKGTWVIETQCPRNTTQLGARLDGRCHSTNLRRWAI
jgi:hypothetical protein